MLTIDIFSFVLERVIKTEMEKIREEMEVLRRERRAVEREMRMFSFLFFGSGYAGP